MMIANGELYFNVICEEMNVLGGKIIHIDTNVGDLGEVHKVMLKSIVKYPNAKWEVYPMICKSNII